MRSCCTHPGSVERPHCRLLNPKCFIREACLWCPRNVEDAELSASCQLGNYPASLPGAAEATEPTQPSVGQRLCRWLTRLIPWNAGLSYHSLVNDFIQAGWGHQRLCNKGAALRSKNSMPVCGSQKKKRKEKRKGKRNTSKCLWLWSSTPWARGEQSRLPAASVSNSTSYPLL